VCWFFFGYYHGRVYPGVKVGNIDIGGKTIDEALILLSSNSSKPEQIDVQVNTSAEDYGFIITPESIALAYNIKDTVDRAYGHGRTGVVVRDLQTIAHAVFSGRRIYFVPVYDTTLLWEQVSLVSSLNQNPPVQPYIELAGFGVRVRPGTSGETIDSEKLYAAISTRLTIQDYSLVSVMSEWVDPTLTDGEASVALERATAVLGASVEFVTDEHSFTYDGEDLFYLISAKGGYGRESVGALVEEIALLVDREPQNPVFVQGETLVEEFAPAKDGLKVDKDFLAFEIENALSELELGEVEALEIIVKTTNTPPDFQTADINNLGIIELIGSGSSTFRGSISSRIHNINLASSRLNGVLIAPGEVFSFNKALGDISAFTGYKQSYIIQNGATVLGDGGGVCQVSTTFFRAALDSGLPIVNRRPHSYRVGYYEQDSAPGIDATIYSPSVDLKIKNDTPGHILIQTYANTKKMTLEFEFYGTKDGREATIGKPVILSTSEPPEDLYTDDPTKPIGYLEQIDYKAWGAKVAFDYQVVRDGEILQDETFRSNYRPWQAKFIRGTGPVN